MPGKTAALLDVGIEILFPRDCVLCGRSLIAEPSRRYPLCRRCEASLGVFQGERCSICGKPLISERGTCMRCRDRTFGFDAAYPLWAYADEVKDLIIAYKISGIRTLARFFGERVSLYLQRQLPDIPVVPVPFRKGKMRKTGWDQVEDLARILEGRGRSVLRCLEREAGVSQKILDYSARMSNLSGKIRLISPGALPLRVVLLDDVLTTGATLSECARVLKSGGVARVDAIVLAAD